MADRRNDDAKKLLLFLLLRQRRRRSNFGCRQTWVKKWVGRREDKGVYTNLLAELSGEDPVMFRRYHRLDRESFNTVLAMVGPAITKLDTTMRASVSPGERLSITLRFLATGESFKSLAFQYRMGDRTISAIVEETTKTLFEVMKEQYLQVPGSEGQWQTIAQDFEEKWNYPCCLGALDGKHVAIQQPVGTGSTYFNYKHFFSVIMLALVDANYRFIYIDVGAPGRAGDAGVYADSTLKKALDEGNLHVPPSVVVEGIDSTMSFHITADDAFPMSTKIMKPYAQRGLDKKKRIYNYRLSRARRVVENAFGIFSNRFRVFHTTIILSPEKVEYLILAACCLHNFLIANRKHTYTSALDIEDPQHHTFVDGSWRIDAPLTDLTAGFDRNPTQAAKQQREVLTEYFVSEAGSVPWQNKITHINN